MFLQVDKENQNKSGAGTIAEEPLQSGKKVEHVFLFSKLTRDNLCFGDKENGHKNGEKSAIIEAMKSSPKSSTSDDSDLVKVDDSRKSATSDDSDLVKVDAEDLK